MKYFVFIGILGVLISIGCAQNIPSFLCDGVPAEEFVRNVTDCKSWIKCKATGPIQGFCQDPYYFDEFNQICTTAAKAACYSCPDPTKFIALYPVENSCNRYVRCLRGIATDQICDEGLQFNNATEQCEPEADVGCAVSNVLTCPKTIRPGGFYAINNETDCSIGLVCVGDAEPITVICSSSLHFNTETLMCGLPKNSGCTDGNTTTETETSTVTEAETTTSTTPDPEAPPGVEPLLNLLI